MLVLAMEFSRCAQRAMRTPDIKEQTDEWVRMGTGERPIGPYGSIGVASEGGIAPGCPMGRIRGSLPQNGIVMPTVEPRAHRPHGRDIRNDVRSARGGMEATANSQ